MSTQLEEAKKGNLTNEMVVAAHYDGVNPKFILEGIKNGNITLCKNINHNFNPRAVGKGLSTKVNANIGTSQTICSLSEEIKKAKVAIEYGADSIMDLSTAGKLDFIREKIIENSSVMVGTVPIYSLAAKYNAKSDSLYENFAPEDFIKEFEFQAKQGVDFFTIHCGITKASLDSLENSDRTMGIVSRGGSMIASYIRNTGHENPLYEYYDDLLDIAYKYDVTLSLGDSCRPGCIADADDRGQIHEMVILGELAKRARDRNVQVIIEGPGHVPLSQIKGNVLLQKKLCNEAPYYVLGPLPTDIAPGYDHIVGAIGGAIAASNGVDFLCYLTPAEHLTLPNIHDVREGVISSKIAAHIGDIEKGIKKDSKLDLEISKARKNLDWEQIFKYSIDPKKAKDRYFESHTDIEECNMCGDFCAVKNDNLSIKAKEK